MKIRIHGGDQQRIETRPQLFNGTDQNEEVIYLNFLGVFLDTRLEYNAHTKYRKIKLRQLCKVSFRLSNFFQIFIQWKTYTVYLYILWNLIVYECGIVYLNEHLDARFLIEVTVKRIVKKNSQSFFFQNSRCIFKEARN